MPIDLSEVKAQVTEHRVCSMCVLSEDCGNEYDIGCPAYRMLKRIAEEGLKQ